MTVPLEYLRATDIFFTFLQDAREAASLVTTNQAYTMTQGVLQTFRRRLDLKEALRFAQVLPVGLRALFVADWNPDEPCRPFTDRATMTKEAQALRADHNFAPETAIHDVARALRKHVDEASFDRVLTTFPAGAAEFWSPRPPQV
jgi:uncharacterized protein (DUF2267 family)